MGRKTEPNGVFQLIRTSGLRESKKKGDLKGQRMPYGVAAKNNNCQTKSKRKVAEGGCVPTSDEVFLRLNKHRIRKKNQCDV